MTRRRSRRPRIVVIHPSDELYGADKVLLEALRTAPADADLEVWLPTDVDYPRRELSQLLTARAITVKHKPLAILRRAYMQPIGLLKILGRLVATAGSLLRHRPDLVYVNTSAAALYLPIARASRARAVLHLHEYISGATKIVLPFVRAADTIIAVSQAITEPLPAAVKGKTRVIYNGFDLPTPSELPTFERGIQCVIASRWNAWKGHDTLLAAWAELSRDDLHLRILGAAPHSGASVDVERLVASLPNGRTVDLVGQSDDTWGALDTAHVVLVPSTQPDPLPTIAIEALAAGRHVIGSDLGGLPEIVGESGSLVAASDVGAWAAELQALNENEIRTSAATARARFNQMFARSRFDDEIQEELWT
ncbi:MAG TPA: glycosyltransferase [Candidatus Agrococcus pullicola]|uniref:Glycosyltransferase n=1 Tax=Candidatus Agrococcus pullicola TaxID=2838429 RepID=A0A9D1YTS1_9MICO|nr:glycosyltransferase [Candidatus Agrococcus pullicola]